MDVRQLPHPDADSRPYWDGARDGLLRLQRCSRCRTHRFYPRLLCPKCWSDECEWVTARGTGTVYSCSSVLRAPSPAFAERIPYVVALIDLDEGVRVFSNVVSDPESVRIGSPVVARFEKVNDVITLPVFELTDGHSE